MNPAVLIRQFFIFCGIGVINTVISLLVILALSELAGFHYIFANIIGYAVGLLISFFLHRNITFPQTAKSGAIPRQAKKFIAVFAVAYVIQLIGLVFLVNFMGWNKAASQILACGVYTIVNFIGNRHLTFRAQS